MAKNESSKKEKNSKDKTHFFKSFKAELKKVSWPTPKQLINNTLAVVVIVIILSAIVFVLDFSFEAVNKYGIDNIKQSVISSGEEQIETTDGETDEENQTNENTTEATNTTETTNTTDTTNVTNTTDATQVTEQTTTQTDEKAENVQ